MRVPSLQATLVTAALGLAVALFSPSTAAAAPRTSSLGWTRLPGAEACIGTRALASAVEARLGRQVFVSAARADVAVEGRIEPTAGGGFTAKIIVTGEDDRVIGTRELRSEDARCRAFDTELALVIAVMIDPDAALNPPSSAPPPAPPPPPAPILREVVRLVPVPYWAPPPPPPNPWRFGLQAGAVFSLGVLPNPGVGLSLRGRFKPPRWPAFELGGAFFLSNQAESGGLGANLRLVEGLIAICPLATTAFTLELTACAAARGGVIRAGGFGFDLSLDEERPTLAPMLEGRLRRRIVGPLIADLALGLGAPIFRDRFYYAGPNGERLEVFRMSPVIGTLEAAVGIEIP